MSKAKTLDFVSQTRWIYKNTTIQWSNFMSDIQDAVQDQEVKLLNPLMQRIKMPGETVRLPSGGLFYKNGELSQKVKNGEVHVYPMSAYDEIVFKSPEKLINGTAVEEVFKRCIPEVEKPLDLFAKDVDYLTTALKRVTFGPFVDVKYNHMCSETATEHEYKCDVNVFMKNSKVIDPTKLTENYAVNLPNGQMVEIIPIRFKSVISMMESANLQQKVEDDAIYLTNRMLESVSQVIESVDKITDKNFIKEWLRAISAGWMKQIGDAIEKSGDWGPDFKFKTKCEDCKQEIELEIPLNPVTFFI